MGYHLRTAHGTLELIVREALSPDQRPFEAERYDLESHSGLYNGSVTAATATVRAGEAIRTESEQGAGPVDALERSLRQCLFALYPAVANLRLKDYRVQTVDPGHGSLSRIRVNIEWSAFGERWATAAVSEDLVEAAWLALVDGFRLVLMRIGEHGGVTLPASADSSWAV